jgi:hypothetical protein
MDARAMMSAERWRVLYAPKLEILERDLLPCFPPQLTATATQLINGLAPLPPIE